MKKLLGLALVAVMAVSVLAFAACGGETVTGEVSYERYGHKYGVKVDVTVANGVITAVKLYSDAESGYIRTSANNPDNNWTSYETVEAAYEGYINDNFVGKTVEAVNAYSASVSAEAQTVAEGTPSIAGGTQSAARIIVAVKDALSKLAK